MYCQREEHVGGMQYEKCPTGHMPDRVDADRIEESGIRKQPDIKYRLIQKIFSDKELDDDQPDDDTADLEGQ